MRAHVIKNGKVVNTIEVESLDFMPDLIEASIGTIGDLWDGVAFTHPAPDMVAIKAAKWEQIKAERDRLTQNGGYYVAPHWYHSDIFSRTQQLGLILLGANIPAGTLWKTLDNGLIEMTQTLAGQIFSAAANSDIAIFASAEAHKAAMMASPNPSAYDFSQGWPAVYVAP